MVVVLDNIRSIYNVGSVFRTADAVGAQKIYLCGFTPTPLDRFGKSLPRFSKVALGAEKSMAWEKFAQTWRVIDRLKADDYTIFAVEQSRNSIPYYSPSAEDYSFNKIALIMGNEVSGLSDSVLKRADKILEIPMNGAKKSLNVATAFGVVSFHLRYNK